MSAEQGVGRVTLGRASPRGREWLGLYWVSGNSRYKGPEATGWWAGAGGCGEGNGKEVREVTGQVVQGLGGHGEDFGFYSERWSLGVT